MYNATARRAGGGIIMDGIQVADTKACCHCGSHWVVKPGSGTVRGFCYGCHDHTCGNPACDACLPMEKRLDLYEKGILKVL